MCYIHIPPKFPSVKMAIESLQIDQDQNGLDDSLIRLSFIMTWFSKMYVNSNNTYARNTWKFESKTWCSRDFNDSQSIYIFPDDNLFQIIRNHFHPLVPEKMNIKFSHGRQYWTIFSDSYEDHEKYAIEACLLLGHYGIDATPINHTCFPGSSRARDALEENMYLRRGFITGFRVSVNSVFQRHFTTEFLWCKKTNLWKEKPFGYNKDKNEQERKKKEKMEPPVIEYLSSKKRKKRSNISKSGRNINLPGVLYGYIQGYLGIQHGLMFSLTNKQMFENYHRHTEIWDIIATRSFLHPGIFCYQLSNSEDLFPFQWSHRFYYQCVQSHLNICYKHKWDPMISEIHLGTMDLVENVQIDNFREHAIIFGYHPCLQISKRLKLLVLPTPCLRELVHDREMMEKYEEDRDWEILYLKGFLFGTWNPNFRIVLSRKYYAAKVMEMIQNTPQFSLKGTNTDGYFEYPILQPNSNRWYTDPNQINLLNILSRVSFQNDQLYPRDSDFHLNFNIARKSIKNMVSGGIEKKKQDLSIISDVVSQSINILYAYMKSNSAYNCNRSVENCTTIISFLEETFIFLSEKGESKAFLCCARCQGIKQKSPSILGSTTCRTEINPHKKKEIDISLRKKLLMNIVPFPIKYIMRPEEELCLATEFYSSSMICCLFRFGVFLISPQFVNHNYMHTWKTIVKKCYSLMVKPYIKELELFSLPIAAYIWQTTCDMIGMPRKELDDEYDKEPALIFDINKIMKDMPFEDLQKQTSSWFTFYDTIFAYKRHEVRKNYNLYLQQAISILRVDMDTIIKFDLSHKKPTFSKNQWKIFKMKKFILEMEDADDLDQYYSKSEEEEEEEEDEDE